jgi:hypothetical protein
VAHGRRVRAVHRLEQVHLIRRERKG